MASQQPESPPPVWGTAVKVGFLLVMAIWATIAGIVEGWSSLALSGTEGIPVVVEKTWEVPSGRSYNSYALVRFGDGTTEQVGLPRELVGRLPPGHDTVAWRSFTDVWIREYSDIKMDGLGELAVGIAVMPVSLGLAGFIWIRERRARKRLTTT